MQPRFPVGHIVGTRGALHALAQAGQTAQEFISRHVSGDWGELDEHDRNENELSVQEGFRILSAYHLKDWTKSGSRKPTAPAS